MLPVFVSEDAFVGMPWLDIGLLLLLVLRVGVPAMMLSLWCSSLVQLCGALLD